MTTIMPLPACPADHGAAAGSVCAAVSEEGGRRAHQHLGLRAQQRQGSTTMTTTLCRASS